VTFCDICDCPTWSRFQMCDQHHKRLDFVKFLRDERSMTKTDNRFSFCVICRCCLEFDWTKQETLKPALIAFYFGIPDQKDSKSSLRWRVKRTLSLCECDNFWQVFFNCDNFLDVLPHSSATGKKNAGPEEKHTATLA